MAQLVQQPPLAQGPQCQIAPHQGDQQETALFEPDSQGLRLTCRHTQQPAGSADQGDGDQGLQQCGPRGELQGMA